MQLRVASGVWEEKEGEAESGEAASGCGYFMATKNDGQVNDCISLENVSCGFWFLCFHDKRLNLLQPSWCRGVQPESLVVGGPCGP